MQAWLLAGNISAVAASAAQKKVVDGELGFDFESLNFRGSKKTQRCLFDLDCSLRSFHPMALGVFPKDGCEDLLHLVQNQVSHDHVESRILSLDFKVLHQVCTDLIKEIVTLTGGMPIYERMMEEPRASGQWKVDHERLTLDEAAIYGLMAPVDKEAALQPTLCPATHLSRVNSSIFAKHFTRVHHELFYLSPTSDLAILEFGAPLGSLNESRPASRDDECAFMEIMDMLEDASGPLTEAQKQRVKTLLRKNPYATSQVMLHARRTHMQHVERHCMNVHV